LDLLTTLSNVFVTPDADVSILDISEETPPNIDAIPALILPIR